MSATITGQTAALLEYIVLLPASAELYGELELPIDETIFEQIIPPTPIQVDLTQLFIAMTVSMFMFMALRTILKMLKEL